MMMTISIVTPTFNRADVIKRNFNSVKSQQKNVFEHIIVDNCSNDETEEIINEYCNTAPYKVIYIREPDTGIYNAMNKGVQAASGDWIHILNSDDYYSSDTCLEKLSESLTRSDIDVIVNPITLKSDDGETKWKPEYIKKKRHYRFPHPGMIVRKDFYDKVGLYNEKYRIISDAVWTIRNMAKAEYKITDIDLVTMTVEGASNSLSLTNIKESFFCNVFIHKFPLRFKLKYAKKALGQYKAYLRSERS